MSATPNLPPPPGGDRNRGTTVEIVTWVFTSIALFTVSLRLLTRFRLTYNPAWDDFWIVLGMLFNLAYQILIVVAVHAGNGRHTYYLGPEQTSDAIKWNTIAFIPGIMSFSIPKLGVAVLLVRLLNPSKFQKYFIYCLSAGVVLGSTISVILLWRQCDPPRIAWDPNVKGKCWKPSITINFFTFVSAFSAATDAYLAAYPCAVLYKLNISLKKKIGLNAVLSLGLIATVIAIYKCTRLQGVYDRSDYTYSTVDILIWTSIESSFIIIAANLPTLRPVFLLLMGRSATNAKRSGGQRGSSYRLQDVSKDSAGRQKKGPKEPYPTDTIDLVRPESVPESVEHILPPNRIRRTYEVEINHHEDESRSRSLTESPRGFDSV